MTTTPDRIEWERTSSHTNRGTVRGIQMFSVNWGLSTDRAKPWQVRTTLPGFERKAWNVPSTEHGEKLAERILERFLLDIGAEFKS